METNGSMNDDRDDAFIYFCVLGGEFPIMAGRQQQSLGMRSAQSSRTFHFSVSFFFFVFFVFSSYFVKLILDSIQLVLIQRSGQRAETKDEQHEPVGEQQRSSGVFQQQQEQRPHVRHFKFDFLFDVDGRRTECKSNLF